VEPVKLIIQIPCFNESETLPSTIADLPRQVPGFDVVEFLVIDDGSTDNTAEIARKHGVDHILQLSQNRGLAYAFNKGLETALNLGADVIVNTDGDNQYRGEGVLDLVQPILDGRAEVVVGDRKVETIKHFSRTKKMLQKIGSWVVRWASGTDIPDSTSGFRAFSRDAALQLSVYSTHTYTLETIIQAGKKGIDITHVPVETNEKLRESRLIRSIPNYVMSSALTILRIFLMYEALRIFLSIGAVLFGLGTLLILRFLYFFLIGEGQGHVQSLIGAAILIVLGFQTFLLGLLADLIAKNRRLNEEMAYRLRKSEFEE
jgi:glycosyltransferase involved in cell wall biosynthesis